MSATFGSEGYLVGKHCTWHDEAGTATRDGRCPQCGRALTRMTLEDWEYGVRASDRAHPGFGAIARWGRGRCFPDWNTLENAYRQAMEGTEDPLAAFGNPWDRTEL